MKHINSINEWFGNSDKFEFIKNILDIVEKDNIEIVYKHLSYSEHTSFEVVVDGKKYIFEHFDGNFDYTLKYDDKYLSIPAKYYRQIKKLYNKREEIKISARKYNL